MGKTMKKTSNYNEWINSLKDGRFTLDGANIVGGPYYLQSHGIKSLKGFPEVVTKTCNVGNNPLGLYEGLVGGPKIVRGELMCILCGLTSLEGAPKRSDTINCSKNNIISLHNIHQQIQYVRIFYIIDNPLSECVLGLLMLGATEVHTGDPKFKHSEPPEQYVLGNIITEYLPYGKAAVYKCAQRLVEAGFQKAAKL